MSLVRIFFVMLVAVLVGDPSVAGTWQTLRVGVVLPLSGPAEGVGNEILSGIRRTLDDLGLNDGEVDLVIRDDDCQPPGGAYAAEELVYGSRVDIVVGHPCAGSAQAAVEIYNNAGVPALVLGRFPVDPPPAWGKSASFVYRILGGAEDRSLIVARFLETEKIRRAAILAGINRFEISHAYELKKYLEDARIRARILEGLSTQYGSSFFEYRAGIDEIVISTERIRRPRDLDWRGLRGARFMFYGNLSTFFLEELFEVARFEPSDQVYMVAPLIKDRSIDRGEWRGGVVGERINELYGSIVGEVLGTLVRSRRYRGPEEIRLLLSEQEFDTSLGPLRFDSGGNPSWSGYAIYQVTDRGIKMVFDKRF